HDDGEQVVMRREEFGFGNLDRLEVWIVEGTDVVKTLAWIPYEDVPGAPRDVLWAEFVDADTLATCSRGGRIILWKFPDIKPLCILNVGADGLSPALSPDRRLIAYCSGKEVGLFDVRKKQVLAQQAVPESLVWPSLAFSPSGKQLACAARDSLVVWDVASGKLERTIPAAGLFIHGPVNFPADGFVLANHKYLIDLENQLKLWTYEGAEAVRSAAGWTMFGVTDGEKNPGALVVEQVPHGAATDLLKKVLTDPSLFVLKAGTTVKINVSGIRDASQQGRVQNGLAKRLETIGCKAGPAGTIELVATVDGPKERTVSYFGSGDFKVQEYFSKVQFVYEGKPAWESSVTNVPGVISLKRGENIGSVLKANEKPNYDFFDRVELPKFLQKPPEGQGPGRSLTLGQSRLTTAGIR
ncbi:MAG: WD40 repeat domain-containing protein, partial [Deltaproteobacteria bacterium]